MTNMWQSFQGQFKKYGKLIFRMLICNIILFVGIKLWNVSLKSAALFAAFVLFNFVLYNILNATTSLGNLVSVINLKELENGIKILKISVASMAVLSWLTTAGGLQEFVFPRENLKALLASFAIQAILLVISLMYCQLYMWTKSTNWGSKRFGKIILYSVTALLVVSMIWSSLFSYVFLADGIYGERRCRDENIILEKFLVEQASYLKSENEIYGESYKRDLQSTLESVNKLLKNQQTKEEEKQKKTLVEYIRKTALPKLQTEYDVECAPNATPTNKISYIAKKFDDNSAEQIFIDNGRRKSTELEGTKAQFSVWYQNYDKYCQTYANELSSVFLLLSGELNDDTLISAVEARDWSDPFGELGINNTIDEIDKYQGYVYDKELAGYKGVLKSNLDSLNIKVNNLKQIYANINSKLENYINISADMEKGNLKLSKVANIMLGNDISETDVNDFLEELQNNIDLTNGDGSESLDVETINNLSNLMDCLGKYQKYLKLKDELDKFINEDLAKTYIITTSIPNDLQTLEDLTDVDTIIYIDENQWRDIRKEDFAQFIQLLKMLQEDNQETTVVPINATINSDGTTSNLKVADIAMVDTNLAKEEILNTAYILNRDLLENITVLEKAINYFKYDFNSMAYVAAFLAVFFDLGSFLAGCLFYAMKSYKKTLQPGKNN